ncbi:hypothetical protein, partial [Paraglaciecola sp.]
MNWETLVKIFDTNLGTLAFALFGALCLTFLSIKEHADRPENDKMVNSQYFLYLLGWILLYPTLG